MGAEGLKQAAEATGHDIRVEIQGSMGAEDELTADEITEADAVIIAADTKVSRDRFESKPLVKAPVADAVNEAEDLIDQAVAKVEEDEEDEEGSTAASTEASTTGSAASDAGSSASTAETAGGSTARSTSDSESSGLLGKLKSLFS